LQLLKQYPTYLAVRDLVYLYKAVEEEPSRGQSLSSAPTRVRVSHDAPTFGTNTLSSFIDRKLADQHFKRYLETEVKEYCPENTHLLDSLLSGLSLKHELTATCDQYANINAGLDAPHGSDQSEVLVVGACIQLLLHGSEIVTDFAWSYRKKAEVVAKKLRAQAV
jgi:hypothetical protein